MTAIEVRGVRVRAGAATLLDGIDLAVASGEIVALVGPNGAGKSTLLAAIAGDRRLAAGSIALCGRDVSRLSVAELARSRAVLAQHSQLSLPFTALEVVQLAADSIDRRTAHRWLDAVELAAFAGRSYPSLSGGEQQRVQLARVLAQLSLSRDCVLLLDEPTSALDPRHQQLVVAHARMAANNGHAVVIIVHDLTLAARCADRVVLLASGRIVANGLAHEALTPARLGDAYASHFEILRGEGGLVIASTMR